MGKRGFGLGRHVEVIKQKVKARSPIDVHELSIELGLDISVEEALKRQRTNITRRLVTKVAKEQGINIHWDGRGKIIYVDTLEDAQRVIALVLKQVSGRGGRLLECEEMRDDMLAARRQKRSAGVSPDQQLWGDYAGEDGELARLLPSSRLAPLIAMRARDKDQAEEAFIRQLAENWARTENWELASSHFYKEMYGLDVKIPVSLLSEGVISPVELQRMWRRLAPALRMLREKPDHTRKA